MRIAIVLIFFPRNRQHSAAQSAEKNVPHYDSWNVSDKLQFRKSSLYKWKKPAEQMFTFYKSARVLFKQYKNETSNTKFNH